MAWFQKLCRNAGLMIHHVVKPVDGSHKQTVNKTVEEKRVDEKTVLRRTTIDEIEVRKESD